MTGSQIKRLLAKYIKEAKEKDHAKLSASGSERWLGCPASISLSKGREQIAHESAGKGTNAHTLLEFILKNPKTFEPILNHPASKEFRAHIDYSPEQFSSVMVAATYVWTEVKRMTKAAGGHKPHVWIERKLHLEGVGFGTTDVMLWQPFGELHVIDYKNGKYKVSPVDNTQGLYYGVAAADMVGWDFSTAKVTIVQPNASGDPINTWKTTPERFEKAKIMFQRGAERTRAKNPAIVPNNKYCWFCPARPVCPAQMRQKEKNIMSRFTKG